MDEGLLQRQFYKKGLRPSRRLREIASGLLEGSRFHIARHQILSEVAERVNETVNHAVPEENGMVYKDRVETNWPFRIQLPVGTHVPFHSTASGKTFLAFLPANVRKVTIENIALGYQTDNTITDKQHLRDELKKVRKQGFAIDNEELIDGMVALAVPVLDDKQRFCASLSFHGPTQRLDLATMMEHKSFMLDAAKRLSKVLFA